MDKRSIDDETEGGIIGSILSALAPAAISLIGNLATKKRGKGMDEEESDLVKESMALKKLAKGSKHLDAAELAERLRQ